MSELKRLRESAGLTQAELAAISGVAQPNIAAYEAGRRSLSQAMSDRLGRALIRPSELLEKHRDEIRDIVEAHHAEAPRVFGSVARGEDRPGSDLDLLVTMDDGASLLDFARLTRSLEDLLGVHVDVVDEGGLRDKHRAILQDLVSL